MFKKKQVKTKYMKMLNKSLDDFFKKNNKINVREGYQRFEVKQKVIQNPFFTNKFTDINKQFGINQKIRIILT